ncbi:MAG: (d)CMP kinase [Dissulfurispiraceae bacterium]
MMGKVIAIDGPSGAGKSTVSRLLAERLAFQFLDTGALYRAVALWLEKKDISPENNDFEISSALRGLIISVKDVSVFLNGKDVSDLIRTTHVGAAASEFSARKPVRDFLLQIQRDAAHNTDIVAEGRDMTTVVFPDAWKKFFIDASEQERARRRYFQWKDKGEEITMDDALRDVKERDRRDRNRDIAPLRKAADAIYIDTSQMNLETVITRILAEIRC